MRNLIVVLLRWRLFLVGMKSNETVYFPIGLVGFDLQIVIMSGDMSNSTASREQECV